MTEFTRITNIFTQLNNHEPGINLIKRLNEFTKHNYSNTSLGWEKWLQYEMLYLLTSDGKNLRNPQLEALYKYNNNIKLPKNKSTRSGAKIDLIYDIDNHNNDKYHAIELKVSKRITDCFKKGLIDLCRIQAIDDSDWNFRSVTGIFIFNEKPPTKGKFIALEKDLESETINLKIIQLTGNYAAIFLGWESRPSSSSRAKYTTWCKNLIDVCKKHGIDIH